MAYPVFVDATIDGDTGVTSAAPAKPTGLTTDDIIYAFVGVDSTGAVITPPSGFTLIDTHTSGGVSAGHAYWYRATASEPSTYTFTRSTSGSIEATLIALRGCSTTTDPTNVYSANDGASGDMVHTSITTTVAETFLIAWGMVDAITSFTPPSGFTERTDGVFSTSSTNTQAAAGASGSVSTTAGTSVDWVTFFVAVAAGSSATLDQEGFAWGDDDGNEATHTIGTQDTNYTGVVGTKILRTIVDTTGDQAATLFPIYTQKDGSGGYTAVPVGATSDPVSPTVEAGDFVESGNNVTGTAVALDYPAYGTGDLLLAFVDLSLTSGLTLTLDTMPNGETPVTLYNALQSDVTNTVLFYWIGTGTEAAGTLNNTSSGSTRWTGAVLKIPAGEFDPSNPISTAVDTQTSTSGTTPGFDTFSANSDDGGGKLLVFISADVDPISGTPTGYTDYVDTDRGRASIVISGRDALVTTSESITGVSWSIGGDSYANVAFIVRPAPGSNNEVYISASSNITDGAATTARLTAPSGKAGYFTAGICADESNVSATVDITEDYYTEMLYVITIASGVTGYFDFRTYAGAAPLDAYTVTPRWTIGTGGISGALSATLANATSTAAGTVAIEGTSSSTLDDANVTAVGTILVSGELDTTLADVTLVAVGQGAVATEGILDATLADVTSTAAGTILVSGASNQTLGGTGITATGAVAISGELDSTLGDTTSTAAGTVNIDGALSSTLEDVTSTAAGTVSLFGVLSATLDNVTLLATGSGAAVTTGKLDTTLANVTAVSAGTVLVDGVLLSTLEDSSVTAAGTVTIEGVTNSTLDSVTAVAVGTVSISGVLSSTIDNVTSTALGTVSVSGALDSTLGDVTIVATAEAFSAVVGAYGIIYSVGSSGVIFSPENIGTVSQPASVGTIEQPSYVGEVLQPSNIGTVTTDRHG